MHMYRLGLDPAKQGREVDVNPVTAPKAFQSHRVLGKVEGRDWPPSCKTQEHLIATQCFVTATTKGWAGDMASSAT